MLVPSRAPVTPVPACAVPLLTYGGHALVHAPLRLASRVPRRSSWLRASRAPLEHALGPSESRAVQAAAETAARSAAPVRAPYGAAATLGSDDAPMPRRRETLIPAGDPPTHPGPRE